MFFHQGQKLNLFERRWRYLNIEAKTLGGSKSKDESDAIYRSNRRIGVGVVHIFFHWRAIGTGAAIKFIGVRLICVLNFKSNSVLKDSFMGRDSGTKHGCTPCTRQKHFVIIFE
jgi:hypothetical protein